SVRAEPHQLVDSDAGVTGEHDRFRRVSRHRDLEAFRKAGDPRALPRICEGLEEGAPGGRGRAVTGGTRIVNIEGRNPAGNPLASVVPAWLDPRVDDDRLRLHIGGQEARPGWKILNIQPGAGVDFVGDCSDLSHFCDGTVSVVYASHVLEHLSHNDGLPRALAEIRRILTPDGVFLMSVPDMRLLCEIFLEKDISLQDQHTVMLMLFGGQIDAHDFHCVGFW